MRSAVFIIFYDSKKYFFDKAFLIKLFAIKEIEFIYFQLKMMNIINL